MIATPVILTLFLCELCYAIQVPSIWDKSDTSSENNEFSVESFKPVDLRQTTPVPIPQEYFQYTAKKPAFAVEVAKFHNVESPENLYHSYPIRPYTGLDKPALGQHRLVDPNRNVFDKFQKYINTNEDFKSQISPTSSNYEVFHPYKAEEPALVKLYKDPTLDKVRSDLRSSKIRLQQYEKDAGEPNIKKEEYLQTPDETDKKLFPAYKPAGFEVHRPLRHPFYYSRSPARQTVKHTNHLDHRFQHPLHQNYVKIKPANYKPLQNHLKDFRYNQAIRYDDEQNEYPQLPPPQNFAEPIDGYDIYEKGKQRYEKLRDNIDYSVNKVAKANSPTTYGNLKKGNKAQQYKSPYSYSGETSEEDYDEETDNEYDDTTEFVPVKNYAQVRRTETMRHLPRTAALEDASNFEELKNAPRLREAVKTNKAQTVYSEEGYEDSAYDHAGEQKHASDHEGHAGYLKEHEISGGRYKIPSVDSSDKAISGSRNGEDHENSDEDDSSDEYSDGDHEKLVENDSYEDNGSTRDKREHKKMSYDSSSSEKSNETEEETQEEINPEDLSDKSSKSHTEHGVNKREVNFEVPDINLNNTFLTEKDLQDTARLSKIVLPKSIFNLKPENEKYPYYKSPKLFSENSPLRYSENLSLIPRKSKGGTEFYDSRSLVCPDVDDEVDPVPDEIKYNSTEPDDGDEKRRKRETDDPSKKKQRLKGLGDKIDCFKAKFFGENPLDSPFFKEDLIANPEPVTLPNHPVYKLKENLKLSPLKSVFNISDQVKQDNDKEFSKLLEKVNENKNKLHESLIDASTKYKSSVSDPNHASEKLRVSHEAGVFTDILDNMKEKLLSVVPSTKINHYLLSSPSSLSQKGITFNVFSNKEDVTKQPVTVRKRRSAQFIYKPHRIVKDVQGSEFRNNKKRKKRSAVKKNYKDIGRLDRVKNEPPTTARALPFVDVSVASRRGEPRYELNPSNHKAEYSPVDNKKSMSLEEYKAQTNMKSNEKLRSLSSRSFRTTTEAVTTPRPFFDVSQFIPKTFEIQRAAASKTIHRVVRSTTPTIKQSIKKEEENTQDEDDDEEYEEYDEEEEALPETTTTTSTTPKPIPRRRAQRTSTTTTTTTTTSTSTTTPAPKQHETKDDQGPTKLRLHTRFTKPTVEEIERERKEKQSSQTVSTTPSQKYRIKSKKTSNSTLVTDTKSYGEDDGDSEDEISKKEVDELIGIKQDQKEYMPRYEKENANGDTEHKPVSDEESESGDSQDDEEDSEEDYDSDEEDDDDEDEDDSEEEEVDEPPSSTTENPKRTLPRTTEAPASTTETRSEKLQVKPVIVRKKVVIHKESPAVDETSPYITKFKQHIKEEEVIKESPHITAKKDPDALELYKDDKLAKEVNKLGDVEIFRQNLDLKSGPRHGGNYRSAKLVELTDDKTEKPVSLHGGNLKARPLSSPKKDSKNVRLLEISDEQTIPSIRLHGGNLKVKKVDPEHSQSEVIKMVKYNSDEQMQAKPKRKPKPSQVKRKPFVEVIETPTVTTTRSSNLKRDKVPAEEKSAKFIEFEDDVEEEADEEEDSPLHGGNFKHHDTRGRSYHGGNYRSAQVADTTGSATAVRAKSKSNLDKNNAAQLLNSFAQAVPILTTTPAYILDPSKRQYFYVEV